MESRPVMTDLRVDESVDGTTFNVPTSSVASLSRLLRNFWKIRESFKNHEGYLITVLRLRDVTGLRNQDTTKGNCIMVKWQKKRCNEITDKFTSPIDLLSLVSLFVTFGIEVIQKVSNIISISWWFNSVTDYIF